MDKKPPRGLQNPELWEPGLADIPPADRVQIAGAVAGQIAHDFNNLLTPFFAYPELIRAELPEESRSRELLSAMERAAEDMAYITQQLLALSRRGHAGRVTLNINDVIRRIVPELADSVHDRNIEIVSELAPDLMIITGVPEQLHCTVQYLCQNSIDAIETVGRIVIKTENVYVDRRGGRYNELIIGEYVKLTVSDNGEGIPEEVRDKIFDPFFTTRKNLKKRGAGLGLSIVQGIAKDHNGVIDLESTPGQGTTVSLYFPICRDDIPAKEPVREGVDRHETVLIVDDDFKQREILARLFRSHGYQVTCLPHGERAVEYMAECARPAGGTISVADRFPNVVVLDVVMEPGIDGRETCKRILEIRPQQPIIMVSGRSTPKGSVLNGSMTSVTHVRKPLTWRKITAALDSLDKQARAPVKPQVDSFRPCDPGRILIVDDEEGIRRLFHMLLSSAFPKATIDMAANGAEAVEAFRNGRHGAILMDLQMPTMHGMAAFARIQAVCEEEKWRMPAVVFCTGFAPSSAVDKIITEDRHHCLLTKPVSGDKLVRTVKERLQGLV
jgi:CheY-like chemotaxis protein/two-component sensor histidine kinase